MESLLTLIDAWHPLAAQAEDNPNDFDAGKAADAARHALELRLATLEGLAIGLTMLSPDTGRMFQRHITGK